MNKLELWGGGPRIDGEWVWNGFKMKCLFAFRLITYGSGCDLSQHASLSPQFGVAALVRDASWRYVCARPRKV